MNLPDDPTHPHHVLITCLNKTHITAYQLEKNDIVNRKTLEGWINERRIPRSMVVMLGVAQAIAMTQHEFLQWWHACFPRRTLDPKRLGDGAALFQSLRKEDPSPTIAAPCEEVPVPPGQEPLAEAGPATPTPHATTWLSYLAWGSGMLLVCCMVGFGFLQSHKDQRDSCIAVDGQQDTPPDLPASLVGVDLQHWVLVLHDTFATHQCAWYEGQLVTDEGIRDVAIADDRYELRLVPSKKEVFVGTNHPFLTPSSYYFSVDVQKTQGATDDDGCALLYDAQDDRAFSLFRIREKAQSFSLTSVVDSDKWQVVQNRTVARQIRAGAWNRLSILANGYQMIFFINGTQVASVIQDRDARGGVDFGIIGMQAGGTTTCLFDNAQLRIPPR
ncbi:DUF1080 domain-containing protein [Chloroflexia bacterium SDU3-3]|nr:DUF1080 domain-containing protein [Chloroflexia bacterium SDU3-3]